jgi:hypothetical protein
MITIPFNKKINGNLLTQELAAAGLITDVVVMPDELLELNGLEEADTAKAKEILAAHIAPAPTEPTLDAKLASVGLSVDGLKQALGL